MEDLLELLPRKIVAMVLVPFVFGVALLALFVAPSPTGQTFVYLLFVGGGLLFVLFALGFTMLVVQSRGIEGQGGSGE